MDIPEGTAWRCRGPMKEVRLLQEALTTKCSSSEPFTKTVDTIFEKIDHAFDAGEVTKDLLKSIAVLSASLRKIHLHSIISRNSGQAGGMVKYGPTEIRQYLEGEQTLLEADRATSAPQDTDLTAVTAKSFLGSKLTCSACKARRRPVHTYTGHTALWCILDGVGMSGKKKARLAHYENVRKEKGKWTRKVTFTPAGGSAFTLEGDSETIAAYLAAKGMTTGSPLKQEFAGLTSDTIPSASALAVVEDLEIDAWIVLDQGES
ncbi:hypothetical protein C0992_001496 [Termitomyces sp. T32_za158]|nr:hypothetical protein C0992_001496 [Termitomyces sp. T32_za158]